MAAISKLLNYSETRFTLDVIPADQCVVQVHTPFGSIEKSFAELTRDRQVSLLSLLEITLMVTLSTTVATTSAGAQPVKTTVTDTASSGDNTLSSWPKPLEIDPTSDFAREAQALREDQKNVILPGESEPETLIDMGILMTLREGDRIYVEADGGGLEAFTIHNIYPREFEFSAYNAEGVRRTIPFQRVYQYEKAERA